MWTLTEASIVARIIQKAIREKWGYSVCLYGSVLYKGSSKNDLDIKLVPFADLDKYHSVDLIAKDVAEAVGGNVIKSLNLKAEGSACYIIEFGGQQNLHRIDMVIVRTVLYIPTEEEILNEADKIRGKRELLERLLNSDKNPELSGETKGPTVIGSIITEKFKIR
jgi:hypothetical protein